MYTQHNIYSQTSRLYIDSENPETSFYPDSLIIDYSDYVRDMYKLKLNDMTTTK